MVALAVAGIHFFLRGGRENPRTLHFSIFQFFKRLDCSCACRRFSGLLTHSLCLTFSQLWTILRASLCRSISSEPGVRSLRSSKGILAGWRVDTRASNAAPGGFWAYFLTFFAGDGPLERVRPIPNAPEWSCHASGPIQPKPRILDPLQVIFDVVGPT